MSSQHFFTQVFKIFLKKGSELYVDIKWINNYFLCLKYNGIDYSQYDFDEVLGPWVTYVQSSCTFALIGVIFGIPYAVRSVANTDWQQGSYKLAIYRMIISNILLSPLWVLNFYEDDFVRDEKVQ